MNSKYKSEFLKELALNKGDGIIKKIGVYIHIPFCNGKCPYCGFYSISKNEEVENRYTNEILNKINKNKNFVADTLYIGGGTPSCIKSENLTKIISQAIKTFNIKSDSEITVECNPSNNLEEIIPSLAKVGVNRISMGLQSAIDVERKALGRKASPQDVLKAIEVAKNYGIDNISLDLMIGIPNQTESSLKKSIEFCANSGATHISSYILKLEENTWFYKNKDKLDLPNEDETANFYKLSCHELENYGFNQYEISNYAKKGFESKHNLKYWNCEEYLGIGASAHSFLSGQRFYYTRDINEFINGSNTVLDSCGGDFEEYVMMRLRLAQGLQNDIVNQRFGHDIPQVMLKKAKELEKHGLTTCKDNNISLTKEGFLLSNSIISHLLYD